MRTTFIPTGAAARTRRNGRLAALALIALPAFFAAPAFAEEADMYYISPNGDGVKDRLTVPFSVTDSRFIKSWHFVVTDAAGKEVYRSGDALPDILVKPSNWRAILAAAFKPKQSVSVPKTVSWAGEDAAGKTLADGPYFFYFSAEDDNDNYAETRRYRLTIDTKPPEVTIAQMSDQEKAFGQKPKTELTIRQTGSREDLWTGEIRDAAGKLVRAFEWRDSAPPAFTWDGKDNNGLSAPEGMYTYAIKAEDAAGNKSPDAGIASIAFDPTAKEAELGRAFAEVAPGGRDKRQTFTLKASGGGTIESWRFAVLPAGQKGGEPVFTRQGRKTLEPAIEWNGRLPDGKTAEGNFVGALDITYANGSTVHADSAAFVTGLPPRAAVTTTPALFSPDGDGQDDILTINLDVRRQIPIASWTYVIYDPNNKPFWTRSGKSDPPPRLTWDGKGDDGVLVESAMDYPYSLTVTDTQDQSAEARGKITIDVLVMNNRIRVPAIIFRANNADFVPKTQDGKRGLTPEVIENNEKVLRRVAEILQKFPNRKVTVEGHANSETGTAKEEEELVPLAQKRAEFVKQRMVEFGIDEKRLDAKGIGGKQPVSARKDRENWWKNRRVEFVLER